MTVNQPLTTASPAVNNTKIFLEFSRDRVVIPLVNGNVSDSEYKLLINCIFYFNLTAVNSQGIFYPVS